ncbi:lycopene cyclase domain-containing protein [Arthrobacter sp. N199823]|uniref:lycopene cyclase domain-containing protein n=1 Tax=unclassified Arthrobacter TaxID=235627 RepID=UPI000CE3A774|nr:lycopene cyclase domain-containing protein [Arthrobacter sp. N199823]
MNFAQLNAIFLAVAALVFIAGLWRSKHRGAMVVATAVSVVVLLVLTLIFDNVMIASGLFDYAGHTLNGLHVGLAPIEDFAYPLGGALLLSGLWILLIGRGKQ